MNNCFAKNYILSVAQIREADRYTIKQIGIPAAVLMENAGRAVALEILSLIETEQLAINNILIFCGPGNNGGDGLVVARYLSQYGLPLKVVNLFQRQQLKGEAALQLKICQNLKLQLNYPKTKKSLQRLVEQSDLVVDAIFGSGLKREVGGLFKTAIEVINDSRKRVVAVDIPSGLDGDSGQLNGVAVKASRTVSFAFLKQGFFLGEGPLHTGQITLVDISLALEEKKIKDKVILNDSKGLVDFLPKRSPASHKGNFGQLFSLTGSEEYSGAAILSGLAALRSGLGLLTMGIEEKNYRLIKSGIKEAIGYKLGNLEENKAETLSKQIIDGWQKADAVLIGCGLGRVKLWQPLLSKILPKLKVPTIIDADGLNALGPEPLKLLKKCPAALVLTPHPGEFAGLLSLSNKKVQQQRISLASDFAQKSGKILVLKGLYTVIASPAGETFINASGNAGMATAGSGDILAGLIAGYLAQGVEPLLAARAAVFICGAAGDLIASEIGKEALIAGDLLQALVKVQHSLLSER